MGDGGSIDAGFVHLGEIQAGHSWQSCPGAEGWKQMMQSVMRKINVAVARLQWD